MTGEQIVKKFAEQYPQFTLTYISFMPWCAYIYATDSNGREHRFIIDFYIER